MQVKLYVNNPYAEQEVTHFLNVGYRYPLVHNN